MLVKLVNFGHRVSTSSSVTFDARMFASRCRQRYGELFPWCPAVPVFPLAAVIDPLAAHEPTAGRAERVR